MLTAGHLYELLRLFIPTVLIVTLHQRGLIRRHAVAAEVH